MLAVWCTQALALRPGGLRTLVPRRGSSSRGGALIACDAPPEQDSPATDSVPLDEQWVGLAMRERYPILRDISASIRTRRTVEEAELALKLEAEYRADPCRKQCRPAQLQLFGRGWLKLGAA